MSKINVAIADDNQRIIEMMTQLLEQEDDIEVVASADNGEAAVEVIKKITRMSCFWISSCQNWMELACWNV